MINSSAEGLKHPLYGRFLSGTFPFLRLSGILSMYGHRPNVSDRVYLYVATQTLPSFLPQRGLLPTWEALSSGDYGSDLKREFWNHDTRKSEV